MTRRIAFLRAVNVGKRTVSMARAIESLQQLGYDDVSSYINSGNLTFEAHGSRSSLEAAIEEALEATFGFEVTTFVRTLAELNAALAVEPFSLDPGDTYFITWLKEAPTASVARSLCDASNDFDTLVVHGRDVHWRMRGKSTDTTVGRSIWNLVGVNASTSRNATMLRKLAEKLDH